jgi:hypothetical protein
MVGPCDFDRVKSNEAYMLVYTLKQAALPAPTKQPTPTPVQSNPQKSEKQPKSLVSVTEDEKSESTKVLHAKNQDVTQPAKREMQFDEKASQPSMAVKHQQSNGVTNLQLPKKEALKPASQNFTLDTPTLKKSISAPAEHPLFGSCVPATESSGSATQIPIGPSWYVNPGQSQLAKRKPDDVSSRQSSTKRLVKPLHSGLQRLREMKKKIKLVNYSASLRVSRVSSAEFPDRAPFRQGFVADMRA